MVEGEARYDDLEDMVAAYEPVAQVRVREGALWLVALVWVLTVGGY